MVVLTDVAFAIRLELCVCGLALGGQCRCPEVKRVEPAEADEAEILTWA